MVRTAAWKTYTPELLLPVWLAAAATPAVRAWAALGLALVLCAWASTFLLQVPFHRRLAAGFDPAAHTRLVATNWLRTAAWSLRLAVGVALAWPGAVSPASG